MNLKDFHPTYQVTMEPIYQSYRQAVLKHIRTRRKEHAFEAIDETIVEMLARYYADWLYLEKHISQNPDLLARNADALNKLTGGIRDLWRDLILTPRARREVMKQFKEELEKDPRVQEYLKKLMGSEDTQ